MRPADGDGDSLNIALLLGTASSLMFGYSLSWLGTILGP